MSERPPCPACGGSTCEHRSAASPAAVDPFVAMLAELRAQKARPCSGGCGAEIIVDRCDACEAKAVAVHARQRAIDETERTIPAAYEPCRFGSLDLAKRIAKLNGDRSANLAAIARALTDFPRIVLAGQSGSAKSSLAVAMLRARVAATGQRGAFVHAFRLGTARIQHSAGDGEAGPVETAMRAPLLLLDDVGTERQTATNAVPDVILERHAEGLPTWVTTWLTPAEATEKYGGGVARRIFEDCKIIRLGAPQQPQARGGA